MGTVVYTTGLYASIEKDRVNQLVAQLDQCTDLPTSHEYIDIACGCCHKIIPVPVYCGKRFCPVCSVIRQSRVRARLNWLVEQIHPVSPYGFSHLTLTVSNQSDLKSMVRHLLDSFRRLRQRSFWQHRVIGGGYVIEVTGCPGDWHAHLHIVLEARYMLQAALVAAWQSCSGGTGVWIVRIKKTGIISYLTKYLTKTGTSTSIIDAMSDALKGARLFSPFGHWYALFNSYIRPVVVCPECNVADYQLYSVLMTGTFGGSYARYD